MKLLSQKCEIAASCPAVYDPETNRGEVYVVGRRVTGLHHELVAPDEEIVAIPLDLIRKALAADA